MHVAQAIEIRQVNDPEHVAKAIGDVASASIAVGALFQWLPAIAALLTIVWTGLRIYESETVQGLLGRKR